MKTKIVYSEKYYVDIGRHVFPTAKYRLVKKRLESDKSLYSKVEFFEPGLASESDILLVHDKVYLDKLKNAGLSMQEILTMEVPYSKELAAASILCCGGTILASKIALEGRIGIHLGGGFHHAFPDHGEGFCVLNDIAVAIKKLKSHGSTSSPPLEPSRAKSRGNSKVKRVLVIDCDLHQGNGTAFIFRDDKEVFTFSIHQENNYPFYKPKSDLDIGLADRTKDKVYLGHLEKNIPRIISDFKPDFIMYIAGADPYENDQIGNLGLTKEGLRRRDEFIFSQARNYGVPIAVVLAGGYAYRQEDTVEIHFNTIKSAVEIFNK